MDGELDYKRIIELKDFKFSIPSYQRGYRWDDNNIIKFIEDIYEDKGVLLKKLMGITNEEVKETEYCIQPLIVRKENEVWNVIDGQQRLTTIFIMISVLNLYETDSLSKFKLSINYKSRIRSKEFLEFLSKVRINKINNIWDEFKKANENIEKNIDFDYMENAFNISYECFKNFLRENEIEESRESFNYLLIILLRFCKFIWYPVDNNDKDEREQFAKINMGKIELTDSELIKAEFMNPNNYEEENIDYIKIRQTIIAESWYSIETELHKPDFWAFIPHENQYEEKDKYKTRIEILFHFLLLENWTEKNKDKDIDQYIEGIEKKVNKDHFLFYEIKKFMDDQKASISKGEMIEICWERVMNIFQNLKELYEDDGRELEWKINNIDNSGKRKSSNEQGLYNLIGFFIYAYNFQKRNKYFALNRESNGDNSIIKALRIYYEIYNILKEERCNRVNIIKEKIRKIIFSTNTCEEEKIGTLIKKMEYKGLYDDKIAIVLLLYNIILLNNSTGIGNRYNFLQHAREKWSREHIFAQNSEEIINDRNERRILLEILTKGVENKGIVIKRSPVLNYINYKYTKKKEKRYSPIDNLKNKGIIGLDEKIVEQFIEKRKEKCIDGQEDIEKKYIIEYAKGIYLIKKSQEVLELYNILEEKEMDLDEKILKEEPSEFINDRKVNYIFKNMETILDYNEDILISNILKLREESTDNRIHKYLSEKKIDDLFKMSSEKLGEIKGEKYEEIHKKIEEYYEYCLNNELEEEAIFKEIQSEKLYEIIKSIKQIIQEHYNHKINELVIYNKDIKNKIYSLIIEGRILDEIKEEIDEYRFPELKNLSDISEIIKKMRISDKDSEFLDLVISISCATIIKKIDNYFKNEYIKFLNDNSMGNMALLDRKTNGDPAIGNKPYNVKKNNIYDKMKKGIFIPLSTIFVFTDLYIKDNGTKIQWLYESRLEYLKDIVDTIGKFFGEEDE